MDRHVKGILFADYVRMIRSHKLVDWTRHLTPEDQALVMQRVEPNRWYPMLTFERMGDAILREIAGGDVEAVRMWGRLSAGPLRESQPQLVAEADPVETFLRFRVLRSSYFDFEALDVLSIIEGHAEIGVHYHMGPMAEEAAAFQTMGFFEGILEAAGAQKITASFERRSWQGAPDTILELKWTTPRRGMSSRPPGT